MYEYGSACRKGRVSLCVVAGAYVSVDVSLILIFSNDREIAQIIRNVRSWLLIEPYLTITENMRTCNYVKFIE